MKKLLLTLFLLFSFFNFSNSFATSCKYSEGLDISTAIDSCKPKNTAGPNGGNLNIDGGSNEFKKIILGWIKNIGLIIGILAVGSLVYSGLLMQFSSGDDEKVNKAKNIIKWTIIGFLLLISASGIIALVINVMYGLSGG